MFLSKGEYDLAHIDFDEAIRKESKNPKFWHAKGLAFETKSKLDPKHKDVALQEKSIEMFKQAIAISENFIGSRFHLGTMYSDLNRFDKALKCFSSVLMKMPKDKSVYIARGLVYQNMGNH